MQGKKPIKRDSSQNSGVIRGGGRGGRGTAGVLWNFKRGISNLEFLRRGGFGFKAQTNHTSAEIFAKKVSALPHYHARSPRHTNDAETSELRDRNHFRTQQQKNAVA